MKIDKKIRFPLGTFILFFILFAIFSASVIGLLFFNNTKNQIAEIERNTRNYTLSLIEASGQIAERYNKKFKPAKLNKILKEGKQKNLYLKAFFVLKNAGIIAHSNLSEKKELNNNIASEEMCYNLTQIFSPLENKGSLTYFLEYNIIEQKIPFNREQLRYLKQYLYENIDRNGWLVTRAVIVKKKKIGTINYIISKKKIYSTITANIEFMLQNLIILAIASFCLSLLISLISMIRYQSFKIKVLSGREQPAPVISPAPIANASVNPNNTDSARNKVHHLHSQPTEVNIIYEDTGDSVVPEKLNIQNAIPVHHQRKIK